MTDETGPSALTPAGDRPAARRTLSVVIRVGALMLSSGATTDEGDVVVATVRRFNRTVVQPVVIARRLASWRAG